MTDAVTFLQGLSIGPPWLRSTVDWADDTAYFAAPSASAVYFDGSLYECKVAHTSSDDFAADLAAGKWQLLVSAQLSAEGLAASAAAVAAAEATAEDAAATASDRTQTGLDRVATGQDKTSTAGDRVATGQDRTATAADRVQTGTDAATTTSKATEAATSAGNALSSETNSEASASNASASEVAAATYASVASTLAKRYTTLALANADIAGFSANQSVEIFSDGTNNGSWYKAASGDTSLTKMSSATTTGLSTRADTADTARNLMALEPNRWPDPDWSQMLANGQSNSDPLGYFFLSTNATVSRSSSNGVWSATIVSTNASEARMFWRQYIAKLGLAVGDTITVSVNISARTGSTGAAATRLLLFRYDAAGAEIARSEQQIAAGFTGLKSVTATLEAGTDRIAIWISSASTTVSLTVDSLLLAKSSISVYRPPIASEVQRVIGPRVGWVAPTGVDSAARDGSFGRPFRTLNYAAKRLFGHGVIRVVYDRTSYGAEMQIDPAEVTGTIEIRGEAGLDGTSSGLKNWPLIMLAPPHAAATLYDSPVYRCVTALAATPNFVWLDSVPDANSIIGGERQPQHRGRTYRLKSTQIIGLTAAADLTSAIATMKGSGTPQCYVSGGYLYFTVPAGVDAPTAKIYTSSDQGLVTSRTVRSGGRLIIRGLETRYGIINLRGFSSAELDDFEALGSPSDLIRFSTLKLGRLWAVGCGETSGDQGDILSGHGGSRIDGGGDVYLAYARDDGGSWHEDCLGGIDGALIEYCGGSAVAIAVGARASCSRIRSYKNQQNPGRKAAAFLTTGVPADGSPVGDGTGTMAAWDRCASVEDAVGFGADNTSNVVGIARQCLTIGATTAGYDRVIAEDCRDRSSTTARTGNTTVITSTALS
ncbi:hypothetical protein LB518_22680 [Mesorhizobium sp. BR1-1-16]|uniref:hypothetical protein n=1 Tax=Mesorhizobium sp. BR1-1-16 TaxID=2876653 RepID=UPI001CCD71B8|nr:hypothetical protein [Mesorhizobium sp. BR1-1-16]MBZ9939120.1 hypothetical protein [Mesorhizobium sp. BR1-1-16]